MYFILGILLKLIGISGGIIILYKVILFPCYFRVIKALRDVFLKWAFRGNIHTDLIFRLI